MDCVEFRKCFKATNSCVRETDIFCCACKKWVCVEHVMYCMQCSEAACQSCWYEEECCLQERGTTEKHLREFYKHKDIGIKGFDILSKHNSHISGSKDQHLVSLIEIRLEAGKRAVERVLERPECWEELVEVFSFNGDGAAFFGRCFPAVAESNKNAILEFMEFAQEDVDFYELYDTKLFADILIFLKDKEGMLDIASEMLKENADFSWRVVKQCIETRDGKDLFLMLEKKDLLRYGLDAVNKIEYIEFMEGFKWLLSNGSDFSRCLKLLKYCGDTDVFEHLMTEKNMDVVELSSSIGTGFKHVYDFLEMILRVKGAEEVLKIPQDEIYLNFSCLKLLNTIGYKIDGKKCPRSFGFEIYPLMCFEHLSLDDLDDKEKNMWQEYRQSNDLKVCKAMMPFMRPKRKEKMKTVILCVRRLYGKIIPKEIVWKILDYCYSPIELRGDMNIL